MVSVVEKIAFQKRKVLSIAGFDPSGGAGVTADLKVFDNVGVSGVGVSTSITYQNEKEFEGLDWLSPSQIKSQIAVLNRGYEIKFLKIGLIQSLEVLDEVLDYVLKTLDPEVIIWDPILSASAGFDFHNAIDENILTGILKKVTLITPNNPEARMLFPSVDWSKLVYSPFSCSVLLKGGHVESEMATDFLFTQKEKIPFEVKRLPKNRHGTGCVLSASILANLAKGEPLKKACSKGKKYVTDFLNHCY